MIELIGEYVVKTTKTAVPREYHFRAMLSAQGAVMTEDELRSLKTGWVYDDSEEGAMEQICSLLALEAA